MMDKQNKPIITFFIIWVLIYSWDIKAQDDYHYLAQYKTLELYQKEEWNELIALGNQCIDKNIDFYYLRIRLGVAYFRQKKYTHAIQHLNKALDFNSKSDLAQELLYYSYNILGRTEQSAKLYHNFSDALKDKISYNPIEFIFLEAAIKQAEEDFQEGNTNLFFNEGQYGQLGIKHHIKDAFSLTHAFTYFNQDSYQGNAQQFQYYISSGVALTDTWTLNPVIHLVKTEFTGNGSFEPSSNTNLGFIGSLKVSKTLGILELALGQTLTEISNLDIPFTFGSVSIMPFDNNSLILGNTSYLFKNNDSLSFHAHSLFLFSQPLPSINIKLSYLTNKSEQNIIEDNGYFVNNGFGHTSSRVSLQLQYTYKGHYGLYAIYQAEKKEQEILGEFNFQLYLIGLKYLF